MSEKASRREESSAEQKVVSQPASSENESNSDGHENDPGDHAGKRHEHHNAAPLVDRPARVVAVIGIVVAIVGLIINFFTLVAIQGQQSIMDGQLGQMKNANGKTDDLIGAANRQAQAAETANGYTKQSLNSADRPWVGYQSFVTSGPIDKNGLIEVKTNLYNSGRSPALSVRSRFILSISDNYPDAPPPCYACAERVVFPGDSFTSDSVANIAAADFSTDVYRIVMSREKSLYFQGTILYKDLQENNHITRVCLNIIPPDWKFVGCRQPASNLAD